MSKQNSRTKNSIYNFISSIGGQFLSILTHFIVRTIFIHTLGKSYLGINGLFTNILTMLSLTEFGVGTAILYKLYEPIAKDDHHRIVLLMKFYKKVYLIIGMIVAVIGLCLVPFLRFLIKDYDKLAAINLDAAFIFILYLLKTVSSYLFFAYKSAIIKANQKEYLINLVSYLFTIGGCVLQIIFLLIYPKFEIYVFISILQVILQNIAIAKMADQMYPFINEKTDDRLSTEETIDIFKDCGALFLYKISSVILKTTDNIVLSVYMGLDTVAMYSNYYVFYTTIDTLYSKIFGSVSHSLGNLHTAHNYKHEYEIFEIMNLISAILGGIFCVGIFVVADEFVRNWVGLDWIIAQPFALIMGFELFTRANRHTLIRFRTAMGLFQQAKWCQVAGMFVNLILSVLLVQRWGISGVLSATLIADWTTFMWFDPLIIHKYGFKRYKSVTHYYLRLIFYTFTVLVIGVVDYLICRITFVGYGWFSVIIHALICGITVPAALLLITYKTQEGQYLIKMLRNITKKILKK